MGNKFKTYEENGKQIIERLVFPQFKAEITFDALGASDFGKIEWIDSPPASVSKLASLMQKAREYLKKGHRIKSK